MSEKILLKNGRVIDPSVKKNEICDILIVDGKIEKIWPMLNLFTEAVRKSNTALRPINVDVLAEEYDRRHSPTEA